MTCSSFTLLMGAGNIDTTLAFFTTLSLFFFLKWESQRLVFDYAGRLSTIKAIDQRKKPNDPDFYGIEPIGSKRFVLLKKVPKV